MPAFSAVAIFCEDIREEKSGQDIIIGTMLDNVHVQGLANPPAGALPMLARLGTYLRIHFPTEGAEPKEVSAKLIDAHGALMTHTTWPNAIIQKAFSDSKTNQMPLVGLIMKAIVGPLPIAAPGKITVVVTVDGQELIAGAVNIVLVSPSA